MSRSYMKNIINRLLLVTGVCLLVFVCFAQIEAPHVSIELVSITGLEKVRLSWDSVEEAGFYNIYISSDPNPENWGNPLATVEETEFITEQSVNELGNAYYFQVTALLPPPPPPDGMILISGDPFGENEVTIDPFCIGIHEVTQAEFTAVMGEWEFSFDDNPEHPVEQVNWFNAIEYCNRKSIAEELVPAYSYFGRSNPEDWYTEHPGWNEDETNHINVACDWQANGYRLLTEAEWNHAANSANHPQPFEYSGSNDIEEVAWYRTNSFEVGNGHPDYGTHQVGTKTPNELGVYDMSGNVYEWCWDIHSTETWPPNEDNPRGSIAGFLRIARGGSWLHRAANSTVTNRYGASASFKVWFLGFRVGRNLP